MAATPLRVGVQSPVRFKDVALAKRTYTPNRPFDSRLREEAGPYYAETPPDWLPEYGSDPGFMVQYGDTRGDPELMQSRQLTEGGSGVEVKLDFKQLVVWALIAAGIYIGYRVAKAKGWL